jgi:transportin-3
MSNAQTLLNALQALYHGEPSVKDQANKWLEQWQQSTDAWQVCNDVLHSRDVGLEAHYFCAQTLRTKVGVVSQPSSPPHLHVRRQARRGSDGIPPV